MDVVPRPWATAPDVTNLDYFQSMDSSLDTLVAEVSQIRENIEAAMQPISGLGLSLMRSTTASSSFNHLTTDQDDDTYMESEISSIEDEMDIPRPTHATVLGPTSVPFVSVLGHISLLGPYSTRNLGNLSTSIHTNEPSPPTNSTGSKTTPLGTASVYDADTCRRETAASNLPDNTAHYGRRASNYMLMHEVFAKKLGKRFYGLQGDLEQTRTLLKSLRVLMAESAQSEGVQNEARELVDRLEESINQDLAQIREIREVQERAGLAAHRPTASGPADEQDFESLRRQWGTGSGNSDCAVDENYSGSSAHVEYSACEDLDQNKGEDDDTLGNVSGKGKTSEQTGLAKP
jgi:hypothetical protein